MPFRSFAWIYHSRSSRSNTFDWIVVLKNFAKFTAKYLCWSFFLIKLKASDLQLCSKETPAQVFSCELSEIEYRITYRVLWTTASVSGGVLSLNQLLFLRTHPSGGITCWYCIVFYYPDERAVQIFAIFARRHWLKVTS